MARTSITMLNRSSKSEHPCLVPEYNEKFFSFSSLSMMLAMGLSYGLNFVEMFPLYIQYENFIMNVSSVQSLNCV